MYVISYDITDNKRRRKIAKELENHGSRVQFSVFECDLSREGYEALYRKLILLMSGEHEDSIRIYSLCGRCIEKTVCIGIAKQGAIREDLIII